MPGKDFEQQVRETLVTWGIEPSAGIWGRLEEGLARKKKRRRALYFLLLAGLLAGGALLLPEKALHGPEHAAPSMASSAQRQDTGQAPREIAGQGAGTRQAEAAATNIASAEPATITPSSGIAAARPATATANPTATGVSIQGSAAVGSEKATVTGKAGPSRQTNLKTAPPASGGAGRSYTTRASAGDADRRKRDIPGSFAKEIEAQAIDPIPLAESSRTISGHRMYVSPNSIADSIIARPMAIRAVAETPSPVASGQTEKYTRNKQWRFGLTAGAGRAAFTEGIAVSQAKSADLNAGPTSGSGIPPQGPVYDYRQDPSAGWELGGWMRVTLSRKWSVVAGVSYMQLSTRTPVGQSLGDTIRSYYNGNTSQVSTNSFSTGSQSEYRNRYHFLQLPVTAEWQLNPGRKLPVTWSMGLTPGYLLSSNALVRDSSQALFSHRDNQRGFQLGFRTGILFRLMPSAAHPLDIGPVLQYQLNEVFIDGIRDNGHLYYLGIQARFPIFSVSQKQR